MANYDPEALGARCSECSLRSVRIGGPVGPETHSGDLFAVVTETPGDRESALGRPLVGPAGILLNSALETIGLKRSQTALHHAVACQPKDGDLDKVMRVWQRENKKRAAEGDETTPSPIDCCRPRLMNELRHPDLVTLGKVGLQAVTQKARPVLDIRGGPIPGWLDDTMRFTEGEPPLGVRGVRLRVLPTLHPGFVERNRRWMKAFRSDLSRAIRWFRGQLEWTDPTMLFYPSPDQFSDFLTRHLGETIVFDYETTFDDPTVGKVKCLGLSTQTEALVVPLLSIEGPGGSLVQSRYSADAQAELEAMLAFFFESDRWRKAGHNAGYFDAMVTRQRFGVTPKPLVDTILLHRSVESELPHRLGYVGSVYTDVTAWKDAHTAKAATTDQALMTYCAIDCAVTARALPQLEKATAARGQASVVEKDHRVQAMCVGLHETGLFVDRQRRDEECQRVQADMKLWGAKAAAASGRTGMNVNSGPQLRDLLFSEWKLTPSSFTFAGDPSTSDEALRLVRTANQNEPRILEFIDALRRYRRASKEYGTYLRRLVPYGQPLDGYQYLTDEEEEDADRGLIFADGRVRPDYNAHGTTSGRLSSSNPNAQNWPKHLRGMISAQPGHVLVGADADQLELRIIASVAGMDKYLEVFRQGGDPHSLTATLMFGDNFSKAEPKSDPWTQLRTLAKGVKYASFYGSGDETVHGIVTSAERPDGSLMYPSLTVREIATIRRNWLKGIPQLKNWWDDTLETFRAQGYLVDPVWGRRRDFLDGEKFNELVNFPIQSAGAHIIHDSSFALLEAIPFGLWGPGTGAVCQVHDALYVEAPCPHERHEVEKLPNGKPNEKQREFGWCPPGCQCPANWSARQLEQSMNRSIPALEAVTFSAKATIGRRWSDV